MGGHPFGKSRHGAFAQESRRNCVPGCGGTDLSFPYQTTNFAQNLAATAARERFSDCDVDSLALACVGDTAQSSIFCVDAAERSGPLPRIPVVLFRE